MVVVPAGLGVAAARASTWPAVVRARVAACPGARPRKAAWTVTLPRPDPAAAGAPGPAWPRIWVMVTAAVVVWPLARAVAAVAPARTAAASSRMVAAWVG